MALPTVKVDDNDGEQGHGGDRAGKDDGHYFRRGTAREHLPRREYRLRFGSKFDAVAINKHNLVAESQARRIAEELGNTLAYYTPARSHLKPGTAGGTVALSDSTFESVLRDMAASAVVSGFTDVVFIGEDGAGQGILKEVAEDLDREWSSKNVDVYYFPVYGAAGKWTAEYLETMEGIPEIQLRVARAIDLSPSTLAESEPISYGPMRVPVASGIREKVPVPMESCRCRPPWRFGPRRGRPRFQCRCPPLLPCGGFGQR